MADSPVTGKLPLGSVARDVISGFEGVVTARQEDLYEATTVRLTPNRLDPNDGKRLAPEWFAESQVEFIRAWRR